MPRPSWLALAALLLAAARPADRPARDPAHQPTAGRAPLGIVTVLDGHPTDQGAFEQSCRETDLRLAGVHQAEIGQVRTDLVRFAAAPDGKPASQYREAEPYFLSREALLRGIAAEGFPAAGEETSPPVDSSS